MIYLVCFGLSALFARLANKTQKKYLFYVFSVISIAAPVLLAGLRDIAIGVDTEHYFAKTLYWDGAIKSATFVDYFYDYIISGYGEPLFAMLIGIVAQFTGSYNAFLTVAHLIIIGGFYIGAMRLKKWINPEVFLLIFYLFFYNHSLNAIRQYVAMAIVFAFLKDVLDKKYLRFFVVIIVSMLCHITTIVGFGFMVVHIVLYNEKMPFTRLKREIALCGLLATAVIGFAPLVNFAMNLGLLSRRFSYIFRSSKINPAIIIGFLVIVGLAGAFVFRKQMAQRCEISEYFITCSVCYLILLGLTFYVSNSRRIALLFGMPDVVTLSLIQSSQTEKKKKILVTAGVLGMALAYWLYIYALRNASETLPYTFFFMND